VKVKGSTPLFSTGSVWGSVSSLEFRVQSTLRRITQNPKPVTRSCDDPPLPRLRRTRKFFDILKSRDI